MNVGFRTLLQAQALGDWSSLASRNRRGIRVHLRGGIEEGLRALAAAIDEALTARA
jgi:transaldolase/glucose-6-phosphate isomerase